MFSPSVTVLECVILVIEPIMKSSELVIVNKSPLLQNKKQILIFDSKDYLSELHPVNWCTHKHRMNIKTLPPKQL